MFYARLSKCQKLGSSTPRYEINCARVALNTGVNLWAVEIVVTEDFSHQLRFENSTPFTYNTLNKSKKQSDSGLKTNVEESENNFYIKKVPFASFPYNSIAHWLHLSLCSNIYFRIPY